MSLIKARRLAHIILASRSLFAKKKVLDNNDRAVISQTEDYTTDGNRARPITRG